MDGEHKQALGSYSHIVLEMRQLKLYAPRDGVVIGLPAPEEIGKRWDREQNTLFCSVGDRAKLRVLVPLSPSDYALLKENMDKATAQNPLQVTIRVQGHASKLWKGKIVKSGLPKSDAKEIPPQLSSKMGGPLAVKPGVESNKLLPQSQVFLVGIDFEQPDDTIAINSPGHVKIHCEYRSCAWWIYRTVSSTFDLGLWRW